MLRCLTAVRCERATCVGPPFCEPADSSVSTPYLSPPAGAVKPRAAASSRHSRTSQCMGAGCQTGLPQPASATAGGGGRPASMYGCLGGSASTPPARLRAATAPASSLMQQRHACVCTCRACRRQDHSTRSPWLTVQGHTRMEAWWGAAPFSSTTMAATSAPALISAALGPWPLMRDGWQGTSACGKTSARWVSTLRGGVGRVCGGGAEGAAGEHAGHGVCPYRIKC